MSYFEHPALSRSDLLLFRRGPNHYKFFAGYKNTKAMDVGSLVHQAILEPDLKLLYSVKPDGLSLATKEGKEWKKTASGTILTREEHFDIVCMQSAFHSHPTCQLFLKDSEKEKEYYFDLEGVPCKAKLDITNKSLNAVIDLKTSRHLNPRQLRYEYRDRGVDLQAGFYTLATGLQDFYVVYLLKSPPYEIMIKQIPRSEIIASQNEVIELIKEFKTCNELDTWYSRIPTEPTIMETSFVEAEIPEDENEGYQ